MSNETEVEIVIRLTIPNDAWLLEYGPCMGEGETAQQDMVAYFEPDQIRDCLYDDDNGRWYGATLATRIDVTTSAQPASVAREIRELREVGK